MRIILKVFVVVLILLTPSLLVNADDSLVLSGRIHPRFNGKTIEIEREYTFRTALPKLKAECIVKEGKFSLQIPATAIEQYRITIKGDTAKNDAVTLVFVPGKTQLNFPNKDLVNYTIIGDTTALVLKNAVIPLYNRRKFTSDEVIAGITAWIENNQSSPLNAYLIVSHLLNNVTDEELLRVFKLIPASNSKGTYYDQLSFITSNLYVGNVLPDFEQPDTSGLSVKLSDFKGKYILVDFWASWCVPCRAENPALVQAAQQYHDKNFSIISISFDDKKDRWLEAIKKDRLQNWTHVSDLKGWNNRVGTTYQISTIPRNFLIGPDGKIIAKNLRGQAVPDLLQKLFKE